jgi:dihydroorotate dehydrogenase (NAD+) catalytic subunit
MTDQSSPELLAIEATSTPPPGDVAWGAHTVYQRSDETTEGREAETSVQTAVTLGGLRLRNPVMPASGCFGPQLRDLCDTTALGAVVTKTIFRDRRAGNPAHRLTETPAGMLNSVGIPSPGIDEFLEEVLPRYQALGPPVIVSVGGLSPPEYWDVTARLAGHVAAAVEVNVSCPNLERGGLAIGADPDQVATTVEGVVASTGLPVIVKLTPNVGSIAEVAFASAEAGASALTVANTVVGMSVDLGPRRPVLGNHIGGLSGPAIKPVALRLAWEAIKAVPIPVIGCGGIRTITDVLEFLVVGATAVQIGTATFAQPDAMNRMIRELPSAVAALGVTSVLELIGTLGVDPALDEAAGL